MDDDQSETRWLSYRELAKIRGTRRESAIRITRNHHWPKSRGNDGTVRVAVPVSFLEAKQRNSADDLGVPISAPMGSPMGEPSGVPVGNHPDVPVGNPTGDPTSAPMSAPIVAPTGNTVGPTGAPIGHPIGDPVGSPMGDPRFIKALEGQIEALKGQLGAMEAHLTDVRGERDRALAQADRLAERIAELERAGERPARERKRWWPFRRKRKREEAAQQES